MGFFDTLFGFRFKKQDEQEKKDQQQQNKTTAGVIFTPPLDKDASFTVETAPGGIYGIAINLDSEFKTERELIEKYRTMSQVAEIEAAIDDIVNESIVQDGELAVTLNMNGWKIGESVKRKVQEEFDYLLGLLDFQRLSYDIYKRWYIDGRIHYHMVIDPQKEGEGIKELRYIDPRSLKKVREIVRVPSSVPALNIIKEIREYYLYTETADQKYAGRAVANWTYTPQGIKISLDAVAGSNSGLFNSRKTMNISYLHKAIKPLNQLRMMEDAVVIYRISRAPERRVFYIDVGTLPKQKAEQYVSSLMDKHRNKLVYDGSTGEIRDEKQQFSMLEDYWLPRREGGKGTEVQTLPGGSNLSDIEDIIYFREKLYKSLNVPMSRLQADANFSLGRSAEITRDELKFTKFIWRLRLRFSNLFDDLLKTQLVLKNIVKLEEWDDIKTKIFYDFRQDNHFTELKDSEVLLNRLNVVAIADPFVGKYFSRDWVRRKLLYQTDEEFIEETKLMENEKDKYGDPFAQPQDGFGSGDAGDDGGGFAGGGNNQPPQFAGQQNADFGNNDDQEQDKEQQQPSPSEPQDKKPKKPIGPQ